MKVLGPVNYGYEGFVNLQNASPTRRADGNFLDWYLTKMADDRDRTRASA